MNFSNMHELEWEYGYGMFWVVNCLLTSSVVWFMHKRKMFHRMQVRAPTARTPDRAAVRYYGSCSSPAVQLLASGMSPFALHSIRVAIAPQ